MAWAKQFVRPSWGHSDALPDRQYQSSTALFLRDAKKGTLPTPSALTIPLEKAKTTKQENQNNDSPLCNEKKLLAPRQVVIIFNLGQANEKGFLTNKKIQPQHHQAMVEYVSTGKRGELGEVRRSCYSWRLRLPY